MRRSVRLAGSVFPACLLFASCAPKLLEVCPDAPETSRRAEIERIVVERLLSASLPRTIERTFLEDCYGDPAYRTIAIAQCRDTFEVRVLPRDCADARFVLDARTLEVLSQRR